MCDVVELPLAKQAQTTVSPTDEDLFGWLAPKKNIVAVSEQVTLVI